MKKNQRKSSGQSNSTNGSNSQGRGGRNPWSPILKTAAAVGVAGAVIAWFSRRGGDGSTTSTSSDF